MNVEVRYDPPGWLDEIVTKQVNVHLEDMGDFFWMGVEDHSFIIYSAWLPRHYWWDAIQDAWHSRTWPNLHHVRIRQEDP